MCRLSCKLLLLVGVLALFFAVVPGAAAQCAASPKALHPAVFHLSSGELQLKLVGEDRNHGDDNDSIVGLWHTNYTATFDDNFPPGNAAPTPFPFIQSYKTWHADGTEFENAFLPPAAGNICFGVWKQLGHGTVKLHHIGLMFDATGNVSNVFTIDEIDNVAFDGKTYKGSFDFKLFAPDNVFGVGAPISEVKGTIAATRITVN
ncbi:MAG: hypothetical protein ACRD40_10845 [Candidatus Acidiferrales bacterium]